MEKKSISTYYEYKKALMDFVIQNGNVMLSERQMQRFIDCNDLYLRFGITTAEVAKDVATILNQKLSAVGSKQPPVYNLPEYQLALRKELLPIARNGLSDFEITQFIKSKEFLRKYNLEVEDVRIHLERIVNGTWIPLRATPSEQFQTNRAYQNALRLRIQANSKEPLSDTSIKVLIKRGGFDISCGLDVETVKQDMYSLPNKYNVLVLRGGSVQTAPNAPKSCVKAASEPQESFSAVTVVNANATPSAKTLDETMRATLSAALEVCTDLLADRHRVSGLLKDLFPERRREVNILLQIYDLGIIDELQRQKEIDQLFVQRFTGKIVNEFGTAESLAESMVLLWCICFGCDCCHIPNNFSFG